MREILRSKMYIVRIWNVYALMVRRKRFCLCCTDTIIYNFFAFKHLFLPYLRRKSFTFVSSIFNNVFALMLKPTHLACFVSCCCVTQRYTCHSIASPSLFPRENTPRVVKSRNSCLKVFAIPRERDQNKKAQNSRNSIQKF